MLMEDSAHSDRVDCHEPPVPATGGQNASRWDDISQKYSRYAHPFQCPPIELNEEDEVRDIDDYAYGEILHGHYAPGGLTEYPRRKSQVRARPHARSNVLICMYSHQEVEQPVSKEDIDQRTEALQLRELPQRVASREGLRPERRPSHELVDHEHQIYRCVEGKKIPDWAMVLKKQITHTRSNEVQNPMITSVYEAGRQWI